MRSPRALLRAARYAAPRAVETLFAGPGPAAAARQVERMHKRGLRVTVGFFQTGNTDAEEIVGANRAIVRLLAGRANACLAVKAPPLRFDTSRLDSIADAASASHVPMMFDSHGPAHADRTQNIVERMLQDHPDAGLALPARWRRSVADAERFRDTPARIRIVKGEWPDAKEDADPATAYTDLVRRLAGRSAPVGIATHDPDLARQALSILREAGTPCELEQLRGLPGRRTRAVATALGVPVRLYIPFGRGWWPYALNKAFERPYLPLWMVRDLLP